MFLARLFLAALATLVVAGSAFAERWSSIGPDRDEIWLDRDSLEYRDGFRYFSVHFGKDPSRLGECDRETYRTAAGPCTDFRELAALDCESGYQYLVVNYTHWHLVTDGRTTRYVFPEIFAAAC